MKQIVLLITAIFWINSSQARDVQSQSSPFAGAIGSDPRINLLLATCGALGTISLVNWLEDAPLTGSRNTVGAGVAGVGTGITLCTIFNPSLAAVFGALMGTRYYFCRPGQRLSKVLQEVNILEQDQLLPTIQRASEKHSIDEVVQELSKAAVLEPQPLLAGCSKLANYLTKTQAVQREFNHVHYYPAFQNKNLEQKSFLSTTLGKTTSVLAQAKSSELYSKTEQKERGLNLQERAVIAKEQKNGSARTSAAQSQLSPETQLVYAAFRFTLDTLFKS